MSVVEAIVAWRHSKSREQAIVKGIITSGTIPPVEFEPERVPSYRNHTPWGAPIHRGVSDSGVPQFLWAGFNYLRKMLNDVDFLASSKVLVRMPRMHVWTHCPRCIVLSFVLLWPCLPGCDWCATMNSHRFVHVSTRWA